MFLGINNQAVLSPKTHQNTELLTIVAFAPHPKVSGFTCAKNIQQFGIHCVQLSVFLMGGWGVQYCPLELGNSFVFQYVLTNSH